MPLMLISVIYLNNDYIGVLKENSAIYLGE
jgi:hypothetical protein